MEVTGSSREDKDQVGVVGTPAAARPDGAEAPDPEVSENPVRRRFTVEYKLRILREADSCTDRGQLGALLRREGLYSSHLTTWRKQREEGTINGLTSKQRGRKPKPNAPLVEENRRLQRENERLRSKLKQAETIIEVQKKLSDALGLPMESPSKIENDE